MLADESVREFTERLSSGSPTPGGGGAAALSGAQGASLISMVCNLTIGKKGYEEHESEMRRILAESRELLETLRTSIDRDVEAFDALMASFKLPKETDIQKSTRTVEVQRCFKGAADSPFEIADGCLKVLRLGAAALDGANVNAISDVGVASWSAYAGLESAAMNVEINLPYIKDGEYVTSKRREIAAMREEAHDLHNRIAEGVLAKIRG